MERKNLFLSKSVFFILIMFLPVLTTAQKGRMVSYCVDTLGRGDPLYAAGDKCACYTMSRSNYFLIFDVDAGVWVRPFNRLIYFIILCR